MRRAPAGSCFLIAAERPNALPAGPAVGHKVRPAEKTCPQNVKSRCVRRLSDDRAQSARDNYFMTQRNKYRINTYRNKHGYIYYRCYRTQRAVTHFKFALPGYGEPAWHSLDYEVRFLSLAEALLWLVADGE